MSSGEKPRFPFPGMDAAPTSRRMIVPEYKPSRMQRIIGRVFPALVGTGEIITTQHQLNEISGGRFVPAAQDEILITPGMEEAARKIHEARQHAATSAEP